MICATSDPVVGTPENFCIAIEYRGVDDDDHGAATAIRPARYSPSVADDRMSIHLRAEATESRCERAHAPTYGISFRGRDGRRSVVHRDECSDHAPDHERRAARQLASPCLGGTRDRRAHAGRSTPAAMPRCSCWWGCLGSFLFIRTSTRMIRARVSWWPGPSWEYRLRPAHPITSCGGLRP